MGVPLATGSLTMKSTLSASDGWRRAEAVCPMDLPEGFTGASSQNAFVFAHLSVVHRNYQDSISEYVMGEGDYWIVITCRHDYPPNTVRVDYDPQFEYYDTEGKVTVSGSCEFYTSSMAAIVASGSISGPYIAGTTEVPGTTTGTAPSLPPYGVPASVTTPGPCGSTFTSSKPATTTPTLEQVGEHTNPASVTTPDPHGTTTPVGTPPAVTSPGPLASTTTTPVLATTTSGTLLEVGGMRDKVIIIASIWTKSVSNVIMCGRLCLRVAECQSVFYNIHTRACAAHSDVYSNGGNVSAGNRHYCVK